MDRAHVFDTETTDIKDAEIIEAAHFEIDMNLTVHSTYHGFFCPKGEIAYGASAVHHMLKSDLRGYPSSDLFTLPVDTVYLIGHNIDFDWEAAGKPDVKRIDTLAMARYIWPEADSHNQTALTYMLFGDEFRDELKNAHSALVDIGICLRLLGKILEMYSHTGGPVENFEILWGLSEQARIPLFMPFGKHKGDALALVPISYRRWLLKQDDVDPYLRRAMENLP